MGRAQCRARRRSDRRPSPLGNEPQSRFRSASFSACCSHAAFATLGLIRNFRAWARDAGRAGRALCPVAPAARAPAEIRTRRGVPELPLAAGRWLVSPVDFVTLERASRFAEFLDLRFLSHARSLYSSNQALSSVF